MNPIEPDQDAINFSKAIIDHESGGNFTAKGKSDEYGAAQWIEPTWNAEAQKYLGYVPKWGTSEMTPEIQKAVIYSKIKEEKDKGLNPAQIAAQHNSGSPDGWENKIGVNKYGVKYDVPTYVKAVTDKYQKYKKESPNSGYNPSPYSNPEGGPGKIDFSGTEKEQAQKPENDSLGSELIDRANDVSTAVTDTMQGKINPVSGILQTGGAIAGGIGDVVNKGLELIPGVKAIEGVIGKGIGALAGTEAGQSIVKSVQEFNTSHPELSKDIGAGFNILTAIPILKGLSVVKNLALDGASQALKGVAEKTFTKDLTSTVARTLGGRRALEKGAGAEIKTLIEERAIPDIEGGKYATKEAFDKLSQQITDIEKNKLQPALAQANTSSVADRIPLETYKKEAMQDAVDQLKDTGPVEKYFDRLKQKYGDYPSIQQVNQAKRTVARNISEAGFMSPTYSTDKVVRSALQQAVEDGAKALGLPDIANINQEMARLIKAQDILGYIDGKPVKTGLVGGLIKDTATVGGEMLGNTTGIPLAGAYLGREAGGTVGKKLSGITRGVLARTAKDAEQISKKELAKKLGGLFAGAASQKVTR